jgi:hypothetical protein
VALAGFGAAASAPADDEHIVIPRLLSLDAKASSIVAPSTFV